MPHPFGLDELTTAREGQVWRVRTSDKLALVIFARLDADDRPEDLRAVPFYLGKTYTALATDRDLCIPASESSFGESALVACWNARGLTRVDLESLVGTVSDEVVEAARAVELSCIMGQGELGSASRWIGAPLLEEDGESVALRFQKQELEAWDNIRRILASYVDTDHYTMLHSSYKMSPLSIGSPVLTADLPGVHLQHGFFLPEATFSSHSWVWEPPPQVEPELPLVDHYPRQELPPTGQFLYLSALSAESNEILQRGT